MQNSGAEKSLHERVAAVMARSHVGRHHSYEVILAHIRQRCPTDDQLRALLAKMTEGLIEKGLVEPGYDYLEAGERLIREGAL